VDYGGSNPLFLAMATYTRRTDIQLVLQ